MNSCLESTYYINCDSPEVIDFAHASIEWARTDVDKAVMIFYAVRDQIRYNPYIMDIEKSNFQASSVVSQGEGFCVQKAILLAATARALKIPSRLRFANVINHLTTKPLKEMMKTNLFAFHGYTELFLNKGWIKATPAFNLTLCKRFNLYPQEFDGINDCIFQAINKDAKKHMEYVYDHGSFDDFPYEKMIDEFEKNYPHLVKLSEENSPLPTGNFENEEIADDGD